jgi:hypothetical protein
MPRKPHAPDLKARESELRVRLLQQRLDREAKQLLPRGPAVRAFARLLSSLRTLLLAVPAGVAREANPTDPARAEEAVRKALHGVLAGFDEAAVGRILNAGDDD